MSATLVETSGTITVPGQYGGTLVSYRIDLADGAQAWTNVGGQHTEVHEALRIAQTMMAAMLWQHQLVRYPKMIADGRESYLGRKVRIVEGVVATAEAVEAYILHVDILREHYLLGYRDGSVGELPIQNILEVLPWP